MATTVFTKAQWRSRTEVMTPWIEFSLISYPSGAATVYRWSKHSHGDVSNYGDQKFGQVRSFGRILRALSDRDGAIISSNFGFSIHDRLDPVGGIGPLGAALSDANAQFWYNRIARVLMVGSSGRAAIDDPMVLARGFVTSYGGREKHVYDFSCDDWLTSEYSPFNPATLLPQRVYGTAQFADCPAENRGLPEAIPYGELNDVPDGINKGAVPCVHVGTEVISATTWQVLAFAGCAIKGFTKLYAGGIEIDPGQFGVDILAPGFTGWPFAQVYRDKAGRRYTLVYVRNALADNHISGTAPITANLQGIESNGDGTGTLIDSLPLQFYHFLVNWVFQNYQTGAWLANPIFSPAEPTITKINSASFTQVHNDHVARAPGGLGYYRGAWVLGPTGQIDTREAIRQGLVNCDCQGGFDDDNAFFVVTDDGTTSVADLDETDIMEGPVPIEPDMATLKNILPYVWKEPYTSFHTASSSARRTGASIDAWRATKTADEIFLSWVRDDVTALSNVNYKAARWKDPERLSRIRVPLYGLHWGLGKKIRISLVERNWALRLFKIEQREVDLDSLTVELVIRDMTATPVSATTTTVAYDTRTGVGSSFTATVATDVTTVAVAFGSRPAGGSMNQGVAPAAGTYVDVPEYLDVEIDWTVLADFNAYFEIDTKTQDSGTSCTPRIYNLTDAAPAATGASSNSVTRASQTITVTRPTLGGLKRYRLQVTRSAGAANVGARVYALGTCKIAP